MIRFFHLTGHSKNLQFLFVDISKVLFFYKNFLSQIIYSINGGNCKPLETINVFLPYKTLCFVYNINFCDSCLVFSYELALRGSFVVSLVKSNGTLLRVKNLHYSIFYKNNFGI